MADSVSMAMSFDSYRANMVNWYFYHLKTSLFPTTALHSSLVLKTSAKMAVSVFRWVFTLAWALGSTGTPCRSFLDSAMYTDALQVLVPLQCTPHAHPHAFLFRHVNTKQVKGNIQSDSRYYMLLD